jgi:hypothetical protein
MRSLEGRIPAMRNMASIHVNCEKIAGLDLRPLFQVNVANISDREATEVNELGTKISGTVEIIPFQNEKKNDQIRDAISWGGRKYTFDEFRSLLFKKPGDILGIGRDGTR